MEYIECADLDSFEELGKLEEELEVETVEERT